MFPVVGSNLTFARLFEKIGQIAWKFIYCKQQILFTHDLLDHTLQN